jgi:hypothetical protein
VLFATEIIGHLFGYAQATNTRALAHLVRTDDDMGNDYIENDFMSPTAEEIRNARPFGMVLPPDVVNHVALIAATLFACRADNRAAS